jgi:predicted metal-dependent HD superfamily phosphohydrolase
MALLPAPHLLDRQRWIELCRRLACAACDEHFAILDAAYSERHRHYHTGTHVQECLDLLDGVEGAAERRDEIELAIWLHDAVYVPWRRDNEERSAELACAWLRGCDVEADVRDRVRRLILSTRHAEPGRTFDESLLQDIDLGVLGAPQERYDEYEAQVRREYRRVPWPIFRSRRSTILRGFLDRESVYRTSWFLEHREAPARRNLTRALERLRGRE